MAARAHFCICHFGELGALVLGEVRHQWFAADTGGGGAQSGGVLSGHVLGFGTMCSERRGSGERTNRERHPG